MVGRGEKGAVETVDTVPVAVGDLDEVTCRGRTWAAVRLAPVCLWLWFEVALG